MMKHIDFRGLSDQALGLFREVKGRLLPGSSGFSQGAAPVSILACDFGASKIVLLEVERQGPELTIKRFNRIERMEDPAATAEALRACLREGQYNAEKVRISVKGQGVVVRFIQFPQMKPDELKSALTFEAENYIPFKINEVVLDFHILENNVKDGANTVMNLVLVAVKRDEILSLIQPFQEIGLQVEFVDMDVFASVNALAHFYPGDMKDAVALLDIGKEITSLSALCGGKPRFVRDISYGGVDIVKRLKRRLGITEAAAIGILEGAQTPSADALEVLKEGYAGLVADLKVSLDYYLDQTQMAQPVRKLFLGGGGIQQLISDVVSSGLGIPVESMDILGKVRLAEGVDRELLKKNQAFLPVAMGLCLRP